jgi:hypothetical protein
MLKASLAPVPISAHQIRVLAVATRRDPRSVINAYRGTAQPIVLEAVTEAARANNLPEPPHAA